MTAVLEHGNGKGTNEQAMRRDRKALEGAMAGVRRSGLAMFPRVRSTDRSIVDGTLPHARRRHVAPMKFNPRYLRVAVLALCASPVAAQPLPPPRLSWTR